MLIRKAVRRTLLICLDSTRVHSLDLSGRPATHQTPQQSNRTTPPGIQVVVKDRPGKPLRIDLTYLVVSSVRIKVSSVVFN